MKPINLLYSIDDSYVDQFKVTLFSVWQNASVKDMAVYVLQKKLLQRNAEIHQFCQQLGFAYFPVVIGEEAFKDAPTTDRYPETIYYRLLAHEYLPKELDRILYMDADILCLNDIVPLYHLDLSDKLFAAASHTSDTNIPELVNKLRLRNFEAEGYFNSGVLLMNLELNRQIVNHQDILAYIEKNSLLLFLPDQDILNALYGHKTLLIPDHIYNYDARYNILYFTRSSGQWDLDWVIKHTVFLHFCGRDKPWKKDYRGRYSALYKHYQHLTARVKSD
ncbi:glycosyltransferase family 8 protein [Streptococcus chenjunshii]|uniref:Glycosyltransferase family 8 protein n=1 Tax=Streptococcus chenjunshii TaxID=2173853 RepID=A0A372KR07_9STRE|nr:glycosyltransferase family 8 protein [Streptococcus chenjunshii]AXQ78640.1 glycosyltransferase family 8 protein [Streptococcus chenjunshii]RFU51896.1 glycosyltransferase family 8 protein [Streptococcus chenjunshii]RFU54088.1 glycosyltransferase family 8 protein [Streptococcus chenjunshii]